jgi:phospholipase/carboxylesterase
MASLTTYVIEGRGGGADRPDRVLVMLHGHGATEHDFTALGPLLDPEAHFLVVGLRGPVAVPGSGHAWFDHGPMGPDPDTLHAGRQALHDTLDQLCADHLMGRDEVVLAGFSQGAAMALALGLGPTTGPPPAGVLCHSGFLPDARGLDYDWDAAARVPVLVLHGRQDEMVPIELGRDTAASLEHHGVPVTFHEFDGSHQTTLESLAEARDWLARVRAGEAPVRPLGRP